MVGQQILTLLIGVRVPVSQPPSSASPLVDILTFHVSSPSCSF